MRRLFVLDECAVSNVPFRPPGFHSVTPHLALRGPKAALDSYGRAFGAELMLKLDMLNGSIARRDPHRRLDPDAVGREARLGNRSPLALGGSPVHLMIYVPDADAPFARRSEPARRRPVLRRSLRHAARLLRLPVDAGHPHRGRVHRGGAEADECDGRVTGRRDRSSDATLARTSAGRLSNPRSSLKRLMTDRGRATAGPSWASDRAADVK